MLYYYYYYYYTKIIINELIIATIFAQSPTNGIKKIIHISN